MATELYCIVESGIIIQDPLPLPNVIKTPSGETISGLKHYPRIQLAEELNFWLARFDPLLAFQVYGPPTLDSINYYVDYAALDSDVAGAKLGLIGEVEVIAKERVDLWEIRYADVEKMHMKALADDLDGYLNNLGSLSDIMRLYIWDSANISDTELVAAGDLLQLEYGPIATAFTDETLKIIRARRKHEAEIALLADLTACRAYDVNAYWDVE